MTRQGWPATGPAESEEFLRRVRDPRTSPLRTDLPGRIWEAVRTAHATGARGAGTCIAIVDFGFDLALIPQERVHPASRVPPFDPAWGRHGTAVALVALAAAPETRLLLVDARSGSRFGEAQTADAVAFAVEQGADVVNLSVEFTTDCSPRDTRWMDASVFGEVDPEPERFVDQVKLWIENAQPYAGARCAWSCRVCDAVVAASEHALVIAASGNRLETACPACVSAAVGVGFQQSRRVEVDGRVETRHTLALTTHGSLVRPELMVDEPPGFLGTSFASPLLAGLAALLPEPGDVRDMAALSWATTPALALANLHWRADPATVSSRAIATLQSAMAETWAAVPGRHRHWEQGSVPAPCALCALVLADLYDAVVTIRLMLRAAEPALAVARVAAVLAPFSAATAGNAGLAWEMHALEAEGPARLDALRRALGEFERAVDLAGEVDSYRAGTARITALLGETGLPS